MLGAIPPAYQQGVAQQMGNRLEHLSALPCSWNYPRKTQQMKSELKSTKAHRSCYSERKRTSIGPSRQQRRVDSATLRILPIEQPVNIQKPLVHPRLDSEKVEVKEGPVGVAPRIERVQQLGKLERRSNASSSMQIPTN